MPFSHCRHNIRILATDFHIAITPDAIADSQLFSRRFVQVAAFTRVIRDLPLAVAFDISLSKIFRLAAFTVCQTMRCFSLSAG